MRADISVDVDNIGSSCCIHLIAGCLCHLVQTLQITSVAPPRESTPQQTRNRRSKNDREARIVKFLKHLIDICLACFSGCGLLLVCLFVYVCVLLYVLL